MKDAYDTDYCLHFAYGANMNEAQIRQRCAGAQVLTTARLADFQINFIGECKRWDSAEETVDPSPGNEVWGVVYKLDPIQAQRLDSWQDVRIDGAGPYFHYPAEVEAADGSRYSVMFYRRDLRTEAAPPSTEFLNFIIEGARQRNLPPEYIKKLRQIKSRPAHYPVPKKARFDLDEVIARCDTCSHKDDEASEPAS